LLSVGAYVVVGARATFDGIGGGALECAQLVTTATAASRRRASHVRIRKLSRASP
jgi:hypothetical protein